MPFMTRRRSNVATKEDRFVILFPAIDLKDGACVRLKLGNMAAATVFNDNPAAQAKTFRGRQGFSYLHIVDLNGAFRRASGECARRSRRDPRRPCEMPCQLGGGIRDLATMEMWLGQGNSPHHPGHRRSASIQSLVRRSLSRFSRSYRCRHRRETGGKVATEGWAETSELTVVRPGGSGLKHAGVAAIIYTDIDRDGILAGSQLTVDFGARKGDLDTDHRLGRPRIHGRYRGLGHVPSARSWRAQSQGARSMDGRIDPQAALARLARAV